jgi:hypothetical protein
MNEKTDAEDLFRISNVLYKGTNSNGYTTLQTGDLVFSEKEIFFIKIAECKEKFRVLSMFVTSIILIFLKVKFNMNNWIFYTIITFLTYLIVLKFCNSLNKTELDKARALAMIGSRRDNGNMLSRDSNSNIRLAREKIKKIAFNWRGHLIIKTNEKKFAFRLQDKIINKWAIENKFFEYTSKNYIMRIPVG